MAKKDYSAELKRVFVEVDHKPDIQLSKFFTNPPYKGTKLEPKKYKGKNNEEG